MRGRPRGAGPGPVPCAGGCRMVDGCQQVRVDLIALGEDFVELHAAERSTQIGQRQIDNRGLQIKDLVGG